MPTRNNLIFEETFEGANPLQKYIQAESLQSAMEVSSAKYAYAAAVDTSVFRDGTQSERTEVRASDPSVHGGWRSEIVPSYSGGDSGDMFYGFSAMFRTPVNASGNWTGGYGGHLIQWHPDNGSGSLVLGLFGSDGIWDLAVNKEGDSTADHYYKGGSMPGSGTKVPIKANVWFDIVFHCNWSTGLVEWWLNGELQNRITVNWQVSRYFKFGMNRWGNGSSGAPTNTWVINFDCLRIGRNCTYADVAPDGVIPPPPPSNNPPTANAGADQMVKLPNDSVVLSGTGSDSDGTITAWAWTKVSGTGGTISNADQPNANVSGLTQGNYVFNLKVTDNGGASANDNVNVLVQAADVPPPNQRTIIKVVATFSDGNTQQLSA